ncbi:deoxyribose-phosphate aldolase [Candidatus Nomurabacteria bacterium]|nr:deoxyribose-phosphate aldolase [Eubacteriales bacterium]NCU25560.1 deoxyribose-phosphate aldolase [Candidatus Nomurabacteria bacterium]
MNIEKIISCIDHTLLKQDASAEDIYKLCEEALTYKPASICIPPFYVRSAVSYLDGKVPVCTVIGFPNGYQTLKSKLYEVCDAIGEGADEIDMVISIAALKSGLFDYVRDEIGLLRQACADKVLKVIVETSLLTEEEKIRMCEIVTDARADYIKTSTGFASGGAELSDIELFKTHIGPDVKIKAAGGIRDPETAWRFIEAGVSRIGSSSVLRMIGSEQMKT